MPVSIQLQTNKLLKFSSKSLAPLKEFLNCNKHCICTCPQEIHCSSSDSPISGFHLNLNIFQIDELGNSCLRSWQRLEAPHLWQLIIQLYRASINYMVCLKNLMQLLLRMLLWSLERSRLTLLWPTAHQDLRYKLKICKCLYDSAYYLGIISGITDCRQNAAWITLEHWVGYIEGNESEDTLYTSECLPELCTYENQHTRNGQYLLPNTFTSKEELESIVCGDSRRGTLCSNCSEGFTLLYHSRNYECRNKSLVNCSYGIPLYIVSELLPVTLLFLVILIFNINFTSEALSSFVFYAQVIDLQDIDIVKSQ